MTRFLSEALGAAEPGFSQSIAALERAAGNPSADIRLTEEIARRTRAKVAQLGLDPSDTTGEELYTALQQKLKSDESIVHEALGIAGSDSPSAVTAKVQKFLAAHRPKAQSFALKSSVAKKLLKNKPPKTSMKRLGYRSADSMLKHEPVAHIYTAALIAETPGWHRAFREQYAKLSPSDFEQRTAQISTPSTKRWQGLTRAFTQKAHHNILSFKEIGAVVLLPIEEDIEGMATAVLLLALEEINALRAHSSFVKLQQVKPDFGRIIRDTSTGEAYTAAKLAGQPVSWRMIQRYHASHPDAYHPEIFEPHVQPDDLQWQHPEDVLADLHPSLRFWQETQALGFVHDGQPVSMSMLDTALGLCNRLPFLKRTSRFFRDNIAGELMLHYLNQDNLESALRDQLSVSLADNQPEFALQEI